LLVQGVLLMLAGIVIAVGRLDDDLGHLATPSDARLRSSSCLRDEPYACSTG